MTLRCFETTTLHTLPFGKSPNSVHSCGKMTMDARQQCESCEWHRIKGRFFRFAIFFFDPSPPILPVVVQPNQLVVGLLPLLPVGLVWDSDADRHGNILHFMNNSKEFLLLVIALS